MTELSMHMHMLMNSCNRETVRDKKLALQGTHRECVSLFLSLFFFHLVAPGLSCGTQDL